MYLLFIIYFSTKSTSDINWFFNLWKYDKLIHFSEYFGLGYLLVNALKINQISKKKWNYILIFLLIFPIMDELIQYFTPSRIPDIYDVLADVFGGISGAYIRKIL